jgi:hypothetical protein
MRAPTGSARVPACPATRGRARSEGRHRPLAARRGRAGVQRGTTRLLQLTIAIARRPSLAAVARPLLFVRLSSERARQAVRQDCSFAKKQASPCAPGRRRLRARRGPALGRSHLGGSACASTQPAARRFQWMPAWPVPCFWRNARSWPLQMSRFGRAAGISIARATRRRAVPARIADVQFPQPLATSHRWIRHR